MLNRRDFGVAAACALLFAPICKAAELVKGAFGRPYGSTWDDITPSAADTLEYRRARGLDAFHPWQPPYDPEITRALYNRRAQVRSDLNKRYAAALEEDLWGKPDERPMGIPYWVVPNRST